MRIDMWKLKYSMGGVPSLTRTAVSGYSTIAAEKEAAGIGNPNGTGGEPP